MIDLVFRFIDLLVLLPVLVSNAPLRCVLPACGAFGSMTGARLPGHRDSPARQSKLPPNTYTSLTPTRGYPCTSEWINRLAIQHSESHVEADVDRERRR